MSVPARRACPITLPTQQSLGPIFERLWKVVFVFDGDVILLRQNSRRGASRIGFPGGWRRIWVALAFKGQELSQWASTQTQAERGTSVGVPAGPGLLGQMPEAPSRVAGFS